MTACSSNDSNKRIVWFYKSNSNLFDDKKKEEWSPYSDFETDYIEKAFNLNEESVQLNDYTIDLKSKIQFQKDMKDSGRPVKRESIDRKSYVRNERFSSNTERATLISFVPGREWYKAPLLDEWRHKNEMTRQNSSAVAELAAQGILIEGKLLNKEFDAQRMADQLKNCRENEDEIFSCAVRLYSAASFLFTLINESLRSGDVSKADTLGPIVWLLNRHVAQNTVTNDKQYTEINGEEYTVYRGGTLSEEMIGEYLKAVGKQIVWSGFTSTSKSRAVAEMFSGNALFTIGIKEGSFQRRRDISSLSIYPDEEEVLLTANFVFQIEKIERDETADQRKYLIYMKGNSF